MILPRFELGSLNKHKIYFKYFSMLTIAPQDPYWMGCLVNVHNKVVLMLYNYKWECVSTLFCNIEFSIVYNLWNSLSKWLNFAFVRFNYNLWVIFILVYCKSCVVWKKLHYICYSCNTVFKYFIWTI